MRKIVAFFIVLFFSLVGVNISAELTDSDLAEGLKTWKRLITLPDVPSAESPEKNHWLKVNFGRFVIYDLGARLEYPQEGGRRFTRSATHRAIKLLEVAFPYFCMEIKGHPCSENEFKHFLRREISPTPGWKAFQGLWQEMVYEKEAVVVWQRLKAIPEVIVADPERNERLRVEAAWKLIHHFAAHIKQKENPDLESTTPIIIKSSDVRLAFQILGGTLEALCEKEKGKSCNEEERKALKEILRLVPVAGEVLRSQLQ